MTGISKSFPGVKALENVDFEVGEAEIHAFLGENGAGKSTLLKILSGAQAPDAGNIVFGGKPVSFASPQAAQAAGIVTIYQEFTLAPDMTVAENVFIGREPGSRFFISRKQLEDQTAVLCTTHRPRPQPPRPGARSFGGRTADGGDRPRPVDEIPAHRHGRADQRLEPRRSREALLDHPRPQARGHLDHLRHPPAGRSLRNLRPLYRAARWPPCRGRYGCRDQPGRHHPPDGGPRTGSAGAARNILRHRRWWHLRSSSCRAAARAPIQAPSNCMACRSR